MTKEEFKYIYEAYFDAIRSYLFYRSGDAELATDITQEVFIKVWEKQFNTETKKMKSLLYKISGNIFINHIRREKIAGDYANEIKLNFKEESPDNTLEYKELKNNYERALVNLPEKQRIVFLMSRMEELTYKEIAERLQISVKAVEKRMSNALSELKKVIKV